MDDSDPILVYPQAQGQSVLVTGGAGYVGCVLVRKLLEAGYAVTVYDLMLYGSRGLPRHPRLRVVQADIRDRDSFARAVRNVDHVIHLACISNDPCFELDPELSRSINFDCFEPLVRLSRNGGARRFVYASTSSVYGVSEAAEVTEEHPLVPLTDYNRYKGLCEPILLEYQAADFTPVIIRPATVCGVSPRMRFDLSVNILTNHAVNRGVITVLGGEQQRPSIHIDDLTELYVELLALPAERIAGETFNVSCGNHTMRELAEVVKHVVEQTMPEKGEIAIETKLSNDPRSYHISARKIAERLGYVPRKGVEDAVRDLCRAFQAGAFPDSLDDDCYFNVRTLKAKRAA